ncbi:Uncharacterised protein [Neisseria gonorrhoeae]|nr:Uncharacterised protein [Neisseria gonorrhoeae]
MADVAEAESCPVDADIFSECDDFKQFAHFMLVNQFLNSGGFTDIGCRICFTRLCQQFGYAQIQQKNGTGADSLSNPVLHPYRLGAMSVS